MAALKFIMFYLNIFKEILLQIGFIVEMGTTWANTEVLQTFFHYSLICENTY